MQINFRKSFFRVLRNYADNLFVQISFIIYKKKIQKFLFQKDIDEVPKSFFRIRTISGLSLERRAEQFFQKSINYGLFYSKYYTDHFPSKNVGRSGPTYV